MIAHGLSKRKQRGYIIKILFGFVEFDVYRSMCNVCCCFHSWCSVYFLFPHFFKCFVAQSHVHLFVLCVEFILCVFFLQTVEVTPLVFQFASYHFETDGKYWRLFRAEEKTTYKQHILCYFKKNFNWIRWQQLVIGHQFKQLGGKKRSTIVTLAQKKTTIYKKFEKQKKRAIWTSKEATQAREYAEKMEKYSEMMLVSNCVCVNVSVSLNSSVKTQILSNAFVSLMSQSCLRFNEPTMKAVIVNVYFAFVVRFYFLCPYFFVASCSDSVG